MAKPLKDRLIDMLVQTKSIDKDALDEVLRIHSKEGGSLCKILVEKGFIEEKELLMCLAKELGVPPINLANYKIEPLLIRMVPEKMARQYSLIPISKIGNTLTVAMADPLNVYAIDDLKNHTGCDIYVAMCTDTEINLALNTYYKTTSSSTVDEITKQIKTDTKGLSVVGEDKEDIEIGQTVEESQKAPIVRIIDLMIGDALRNRASDIHIEPEDNGVRVRFRIDGALYDTYNLPKKHQNAVLVRLKIMSHLDITEWRLPQDGRFKIKMTNREIDFRVSILPTTFGQKVVLRILDKSSLSTGLEGLNFSAPNLKLFKEAIAKPFGMVLVTGPTGSGKSTTLYSAINKLNTPQVNIITVEDPVEYEIEGITQIQVKTDIGLTFANGLRSLLRQNPDIILIGEIRDSETADIAVKAALTGQLVLSTLHTNDATGAITRLIDMGVEPFLVASSLVMICAQRLCRKICQNCREPLDLPNDMLVKMGMLKKPEELSFTIYHGKGCKTCQGTGYHGRMAILEVLMMDDNIRQMIIKGSSSDQIKEYAVKEKSMMTLRDDALIRVKDGTTTLEEEIRVTTEE